MTHLTRRTMLVGGAAALGGAAAVATGTAAEPATTPSGRTGRETAATVTPDDARYRDMVQGSNPRWVGSPGAVRVAGTTKQVIDAVREAVHEGKRLSVRSGGHCYEDFVFNPEVDVVIDMSVMNGVYYDAARRAFVVEAGAQLFDVYQKLYRYWGVTIPGGSCSSVGAGGHVCGGGYGLLSRQHGTTVDHLYGIEVVVVGEGGRVRSVVATRDDDDPHRDLWWAHTGGGGGNFGIVTKYFFRSPGTAKRPPTEQLPTPPAHVYINSRSWRWSDLTESTFHRLLTNYGTFYEANSDPDSPYAIMYSKLAINTRASGSISLVTQMDATVPGAAQLLASYLAALDDGMSAAAGPMTTRAGELDAMPQFFEPQSTPWLRAARQLGGTGWTSRADYKSAYMRTGFPDDQIEAIYSHMTGSDVRGPLLQVDSYGGRINAIEAGQTAVAQRDSVLKLQYQSYWSDPAEDADRIGWLREFYRDVYSGTGGVPAPGDVTDGCYVNYPDTDISDPAWNTSGVPWHDLYYKDGYARLQQVKGRWDPNDVFRHAQSVRLPGR
jgi:FAD/FMN-containing dehydrogenase